MALHRLHQLKQDKNTSAFLAFKLSIRHLSQFWSYFSSIKDRKVVGSHNRTHFFRKCTCNIVKSVAAKEFETLRRRQLMANAIAIRSKLRLKTNVFVYVTMCSYSQREKAESECLAGSSTRTSAGPGCVVRDRWGGYVAGQRHVLPIQYSQQSLPQ